MRILGGYIYHVTGTDTYLAWATMAFTYLSEILRVAAATASGGFSLNDRTGTNFVRNVDTKDLWLNEDCFLTFWGDATVTADLWVEELPLTPEELTAVQKEMKK